MEKLYTVSKNWTQRVQWLGLRAPKAGVPGLIPGWGTRSPIPQLGPSTARKNKTKQKPGPGADCGSDHELLLQNSGLN